MAFPPDSTVDGSIDRSVAGPSGAPVAVHAGGFTLLELIIALALLSILVSVAVPSFSDTIADSRLSDIERSLAATVRMARQEASTRGQRIVICARASDTQCGDDWSDGWLAFADGRSGTVLDVDAGEVVIGSRPPLGNDRTTVTVTQRAPWSTTTVAASSIAMQTGVRAGTSLIVICDQRGVERARAIVIEPSGALRTELGRNGSGQRLDPWNAALACPP